jgi:hypothetical protein
MKGINYHETLFPVSKDSFRIIIILVSIFDLELYQIDVKTTFLNRDLENEVSISQYESFGDNS